VLEELEVEHAVPFEFGEQSGHPAFEVGVGRDRTGCGQDAAVRGPDSLRDLVDSPEELAPPHDTVQGSDGRLEIRLNEGLRRQARERRI
jgi:hypothetical protein